MSFSFTQSNTNPDPQSSLPAATSNHKSKIDDLAISASNSARASAPKNPASLTPKSPAFERAWPEYSPTPIKRCTRCRRDFGGPGKRCWDCRQHDREYRKSPSRLESYKRYNHSSKGTDRDRARNRKQERMDYMLTRGRISRYNKRMEEVDANPFARSRRPRGWNLFLAATGQRWYGRVL